MAKTKNKNNDSSDLAAKAKEASRMSGDDTQTCLDWIKANQDLIRQYTVLNQHHRVSHAVSAARCYTYYKQRAESGWVP